MQSPAGVLPDLQHFPFPHQAQVPVFPEHSDQQPMLLLTTPSIQFSSTMLLLEIVCVEEQAVESLR